MGNNTTEPKLWQKAIANAFSVLLGAVVGVAPALYVTNHQADLQRQQLILDRKITAIKDFAGTSWRGPAERTVRIVDLKSRIGGILATTKPDARESEMLVADYGSLLSSFAQWSAEQASQAVLTSALTGIEAPPYPNVNLTVLRWKQMRGDSPSAQRQEWGESRSTLEAMGKDDVAFNLAVREYVSKAAASITILH